MSGRSPAQQLANLPDDQREAWVRRQGERKMRALRRSWRFWARPEQLEPSGLWRWWLVKTGRGWGKNRAAAEWVLDRAEAFAAANAEHLIGLANRTFGEVASLQIKGVSGLRRCGERRGYIVDHAGTAREGRLIIPRPGTTPHVSRIELHTSVDPDLARGRNTNTLWLDELASFRNIKDEHGGTTFSNLDLGLREVGPLPPRGIATTTPRFVPWLVDLMGGVAATAGPLTGAFGPVYLTEGALFDNLTNLDPDFVRTVLDRYAHSPLGAQEIYGRLLDSVEGALWTPYKFERSRVLRAPDIFRVVVGVDPPGESWGSEAGIVVCGVGWGPDRRLHLYVLADYSISEPTADDWPPEVVRAYRDWDADLVVVEKNNGGDMVRKVIHVEDRDVRVKKVSATKGKYVRAEPVARLWGEDDPRGHCVGYHPLLESQCNTWVPGHESPDRMDAMVWAATDLLGEVITDSHVGAYGTQVANTRVG